MELEQNCTIYKKGDFSIFSNDYLYLLYAPLLKSDACMLYGLLSSLDHKSMTLGKLVMLYSGYTNRFELARKTLEQFDLIKTLYNESSKEWIFEVYAPLNAAQFFRHDTFSRLFLNECGSTHYDTIKCHFAQEENNTGFSNISMKMDHSRLDTWTDKKEENFLRLQPSEDKIRYDFDFETFLKGADRIFPMRYRTKENLSRIAQLASIHGINALDMRKYVQRSINPSTHVFDFEKLKKQVYANRTIVQVSSDPYSISPVKFLMNKQKGTPVAQADQKLINKLIEDYKFSNEVMNVLIEYCLDQTNQQFTKAYVEKVAASWVRLGIDSKEKALNAGKQEKPKKENKLPEWYSNTAQSKPDEALLQEALELQRKLKGEN